MKLRHQLAAYSPLSFEACVRAGVAAMGVGDDPRDRLRAVLLEEYEAQCVVLCGSGTQALQLAIGAASREVYGDAADPVLIAMPAFSCFDLASAAIGANVRVALYDLDPLTLGPNMASLERVIAFGARVVVVAPLYGIPVDWERIETLADRYRALVIEDAAQGHGASWRGRKLGSLGRISTLSFGRGKGWTGGGGGAVLFRRGAETIAELMMPGTSREMKTVAGLVAQWTLGRPSTYGIPRSIPSLHLGETTYHPPATPVAIARAAAKAVLVNDDRSLREAEHRRKFAATILAAIEPGAALEPVAVADDAEAGYLRLPLRSPGRKDPLDAAARQAGVETSYPIALSRLPELISRLEPAEHNWPGAERLANQLLTFPTHSQVRFGELQSLLR